MSVNLRCTHCQDWSVEEWDKVQDYIDKLAEQHERKKERKAEST